MARFNSGVLSSKSIVRVALDGVVRASGIFSPSQRQRAYQKRMALRDNLGSPKKNAKLATFETKPAEAEKAEAEGRFAVKEDLIGHVEKLSDLIAGQHFKIKNSPAGSALLNTTQSALLDIKNELDRLKKDLETCDASQRHQVASDYYRKINSRCNQIKRTFPKDCKAAGAINNTDPARFRIAAETEMFGFFDTLGALATEQKRFHYTRAADVRLTAYVKARANRMLKSNPGLVLGRPGSEAITNTEATAGVIWGYNDKKATLAASATLIAQKDSRRAADEDEDSMLHETGNVGLRIGFGSNICKWINIGLGVKPTFTFGNYHSHVDFEDSLRAETVRQADRWAFAFRSGDTGNCKVAVSQAYRKTKEFGKWAITLGSRPIRTAEEWDERIKPNVNGAKLRKGMNNGIKIEALTSRLYGYRSNDLATATTATVSNEFKGNSELKNTLNKVYGTLKLKSTGEAAGGPRFSLDNGAGDVFKQYSPLQSIKPLGAPSNGNPIHFMGFGGKWHWPSIMRFGLTVDFTFTVKRPRTKANLSAPVGIEATSDYSYNKLKLRRLRPAHEFLKTQYAHDLKKPEQLLEDLKSKHAESPRLYLLKNTGWRPETTFTTKNKDGVASKSVAIENLQKSNADLQALCGHFEALTQVSAKMKAAKDKKFQKTAGDGFNAALELEQNKLLKDVLGITDDHHKERCAKLRGNHDLLVAECYDAISIALGAVGLNITKQKLKLVEEHGAHLEHFASALEGVDKHYNYLDAVISGTFLPIDQEDLLRTGLLQAPSDSNNHALSGTAKASASFVIPALEKVSGNDTAPTTPEFASTQPSLGAGLGPSTSIGQKKWGMVNDATLLGLSYGGTRTRRWIKSHPNFLRMGRQDQIRETIHGSGSVGALLDWAMAGREPEPHTTYKAKAPTRFGRWRQPFFLRNPNVSRQAGFGLLRIAEAVLGSGLQDTAVETEVFTGYRTPPSDSAGKCSYKTSLQFRRYLGRRSVKHGLTFGIPSKATVHTGLIKPVVSGARKMTETSVNVETLGDCPASHILVFNQLKKAMARSSKNNASLDVEDLNGTLDKNKLLQFFNDGKVKNSNGDLCNDSNPTTTDPSTRPRAEQNGMFLQGRYFGDRNAILGMMKDFQRYQYTRRPLAFDGSEDNSGPKQNPGAPEEQRTLLENRTEFHRLDDTKETRALMSNKYRADIVGAGQFVKSGETLETRLAALMSVALDPAKNPGEKDPRDPRPHIPEGRLAEAMRQVEAYLNEHDSISPTNLMDLYLSGFGGEKLSEPRESFRFVFESYVKVCDSYASIMNAAKDSVRYVTQAA